MTWEWVVLILGFGYWIIAMYLIESFRRKWGVSE